jgi:hypothetical protein
VKKLKVLLFQNNFLSYAGSAPKRNAYFLARENLSVYITTPPKKDFEKKFSITATND